MPELACVALPSRAISRRHLAQMEIDIYQSNVWKLDRALIGHKRLKSCRPVCVTLASPYRASKLISFSLARAHSVGDKRAGISGEGS